MAHHKAALKSIRQDQRRTERNRYFKTTMRSSVKQVRNLLAENKVDEAKALLPATFSTIDKCVTKKVLHQNTAARYKSRLTTAVAEHKPEAKPAKLAKSGKPKTAKPKAPKAEKPAKD